jgi:DNA-binding XRE family transcriptional regulator
MKNAIKIPRILKIKSIKGFNIYCVFNNGETRLINFQELFAKWKISKDDPEFALLKLSEFKKAKVRNQTLSWKNIKTPLLDKDKKEVFHPYEIGPDVLYEFSKKIEKTEHRFYFGSVIKKIRREAGISQDELARLSGTSKTYISRIENNLLEPALTTLYKIVEIGLGKKLKIEIKNDS